MYSLRYFKFSQNVNGLLCFLVPFNEDSWMDKLSVREVWKQCLGSVSMPIMQKIKRKKKDVTILTVLCLENISF